MSGAPARTPSRIVPQKRPWRRASRGEVAHGSSGQLDRVTRIANSILFCRGTRRRAEQQPGQRLVRVHRRGVPGGLATRTPEKIVCTKPSTASASEQVASLSSALRTLNRVPRVLPRRGRPALLTENALGEPRIRQCKARERSIRKAAFRATAEGHWREPVNGDATEKQRIA
jgi:hypothetical protein